MNFKEYAEKARKTAFYPHDVTDFRMAYLALKMCGEAQELVSANNPENEIKEAGDMAWYLSQFNLILYLDVQDVFDKHILLTSENPHYKILNTACKIAERVGKIYRDSEGLPESKDYVFFTECVSNILTYLKVIAYQHGLTIEHVYYKNLEKLADRQKRGKLGGSGDDR